MRTDEQWDRWEEESFLDRALLVKIPGSGDFVVDPRPATPAVWLNVRKLG